VDRYDAHYLPGPQTRVTRLSEPANYRVSRDDPADRSVLCAEIPCAVGDPVWTSIRTTWPSSSGTACGRAGSRGAARRCRGPPLPHVYPIYEIGYADRLRPLDEWVDGLDRVTTFGRLGLFAHDNTHHAMAEALDAVAALRPDGTRDPGSGPPPAPGSPPTWSRTSQRGLEVHVLDIVEDGPKPELVKALGATYHSVPLPETGLSPDVVIECTGVASVVIDAISCTGRDGVTCLTGVSPTGRSLRLDVGSLNRTAVLENDAIVGSVNANRRHYEAGARALARADAGWLGRLVTRRLPLDKYADGLDRKPADVKVVLTVADDAAGS
jgi:hypothetical protein